MQENDFLSRIFSWTETAMGFWALVLASLAILFHIVGFVARLTRKAKIDFVFHGFPEIGFSWFGPTISMWLQFRVIGKDTFLRKVGLTIENLRTHERHNFRWVTFNELRHDPLTLNPLPQSVIKEIAAGFFITPTQPEKTNISFHDDRTAYGEMRRIQDIGNQAILQLAQGLGVPASDQAVIDQFNGSQSALDVYRELGNVFYWTDANYEMTIEVETDEGNFTKTFSFAISADDSRRLDINRAIMSALHPADSPPTFQFAYPRLNEVL